jgi:hypothetical protein
MAEKKEYRYEVLTVSEDAGITFLDRKTKKTYRLDEDKRELVGIGEENLGKRIKITKEMDIETTVPFFKKQKAKLKGYDIYENIIGSRFIHDKEKKLFIGIDKENKNIILHVTPQAKMPVFVTLPFVHYPMYIESRKFSEYPYAFTGTAVAGLQVLIPLIDELSAVNPVLATALATTPAIAGVIAEKVVRNKAFQKDVRLFEKLVHEEYTKFKGWEKSHIGKKLEKVI